MRLLLDTVAILRWLQPAPPLSRGAHDAIVQASEVYVSAVSAVEIAVKAAVGKLRTPDDLAERIVDKAMIELPLTVRHGLAMRDLPLYHRDPFDRLLIAQAIVDKLDLVSTDSAFDR